MTEPTVSIAASLESQLARAADEFMAERRRGQWPSVEDFAARHPDIADELRRVLPALAMLDPSQPHAIFAEPDPESGILGDFRLIREVGRGGMGVVYEVEQISLNRRVALKVLPFAATMDPRQLQRFKNEALAAASLRHEHIVHVYGVGCERGVHYYAMQLIEGQSLAAMIADGVASRERQRPEGSRPPVADAPGSPRADAPGSPTTVAALTTKRDKAHFRRIAELIAQAADALEYAHSMGVVHRDVKPANMMLDHGGHLWVTDFGLAKLSTAADITMTGDIVGTLRYMSPEQALAKHGLVDHRTDVYSLGATLYELLTLRPTVDGDDKQEVLRRIAFEEPVPPRKLDKAIPAELATISLKALAKAPTERYATVGELAVDLRRWLSDQAIAAKPPGWRERAAKWCRRHKYLVRSAAVVLAVAVTALTGGALLLWQKEKEIRVAYQAESVQRRLAASNLKRALAALDQVYSRTVERIPANKQVTPDDRALLEQLLTYYDDFARENATEPMARAATMLANARVASIQWDLGQDTKAEAAFRRSIALARSLAAESPVQDQEYLSHLSASLNDLGMLLYRDPNRRAEAEQLLREAVQSYDRLVAMASDGQLPRLSTWVMYSANLGTILTETGKLDEAEQVYRRLVNQCRRIVALPSARPDDRSSFACTLHGLAKLLTDQGKPAEARPLLDEAIEHQRAALDRSPREPSIRLHLSSHFNSLAYNLVRLGENARAATTYERAIATTEPLVRDYPAVAEYRFKLAGYLLGLGGIEGESGRTGEAAKTFRRAADSTRKLVEEYPDKPEYLNQLAQCYHDLGLTYVHSERKSEAAKAWRQAIVVSRKLVTEYPDWQLGQQHLLSSLEDLSLLQRELGDSQAGEAMGRESVAGRRERLARSPNEPRCKHDLAGALSILAAFHFDRDQATEALRLLDEAIPLQEEAVRSLPWFGHSRTNLADQYAARAACLVNTPGAQFYDPSRAVELARQALKLNPTYPEARLSLGMAQYRAGDPFTAAGNLEGLSKCGPRELCRAWLYLAMAYRQQGDLCRSVLYYLAAAQWLDRNQPTGGDLNRLRSEAAALLGIVTK